MKDPKPPKDYRSSYGRLMRMPGWGIYDSKNKLVGTLSAPNKEEARKVFERAGMEGEVRPL